MRKVKVHKSRWSHEEQDCDYYFHQWLMDGGKTFCLCEDLETKQMFSFEISKYPVTFLEEQKPFLNSESDKNTLIKLLLLYKIEGSRKDGDAICKEIQQLLNKCK